MSTRELFTTALQHHRAGRLVEAEALYRQILATETEHPDSLHMLGVIAQQSGQPHLAIELIRRAISHNGAVMYDPMPVSKCSRLTQWSPRPGSTARCCKLPWHQRRSRTAMSVSVGGTSS